MSDEKEWQYPFCASRTTLDCPKCKAEDAVLVREHDQYFDGNAYVAFCDECHAKLEVTACVDITFYDAEVRE